MYYESFAFNAICKLCLFYALFCSNTWHTHFYFKEAMISNFFKQFPYSLEKSFFINCQVQCFKYMIFLLHPGYHHHWTVTQTSILNTLNNLFAQQTQTTEYRDSLSIWVNPCCYLINIFWRKISIFQFIFSNKWV